MTLNQLTCKTVSCRDVRKDIGQLLDEMRQSGTPDTPELMQRMQQWHDQLLEAENTQANSILRLQERMKELNCLYAVIDALQTSRPDLKFDEVIPKVLDILPGGLLHPERVGISLRIGEKSYTTPLFHAYGSNPVASCTAGDGIQIELRVSLQTGNGNGTRVQFLEEEQVLLDKTVRLIRRFYHHHLNVARLSGREKQLRTTIHSIGDGVITSDRDGNVDKMNRVAEERSIQRALEESEKKFRNMVEHAPEPIAIITDQRIAYLNPAATALYGADGDGSGIGHGNGQGHGLLIGTPVMDRIHPDFHDVVKERIHQLINKEKAHTDPGKQSHIKLDGSPVWVDVVCSPISYEGKSSILLFLRDITRQVEYEKQIHRNLQEKEVMLAEIHHRVKNNLAVISSLLELEAGISESPETVDVLRKAEGRVRSMALIHEKLYQSESLAEIAFKSYVTELADFVKGYFCRSDLSVDMQFDLEPVLLDITRAVPCGIILNEILTNGLKYAFPDRKSGSIALTLQESAREIRLIYRDNGVGIPEEILALFRTGQAATLGMELILALTRQLNGSMDITNHEGTRIELRFPKNQE